MIICMQPHFINGKSSQGLEMKCTKVGVRVFFNKHHFYAGDVHACPDCHIQVIVCNSSPGHDEKGYDEKDPTHVRAHGYKE